MSAFWGNFAGVVTVILMVCFIGIWVWAWRPRHRRVFDAMAQVPMGDALSLHDAVTAAPEASMNDSSGNGRMHEDATR
ncbi:cbb3-type cytochrome c oxidase component FixQ [Steroidobacter denitrificans]|uniref:Cbb3-type cytochrome c oxidase component FixQ n=1 Tax=Steroidobacter denitrificans TaxID=465721 RepID=A0A127F8R8_STEDE|nr:cbb3-type cytochrome c oxidase subunit 3 [Steroidobacter denitrificans]AMN45998.1 cbb3-type cytochrome c oxidase component FixQ [Steroidobacter denitrificans]